jgi:hypothetical protein
LEAVFSGAVAEPKNVATEVNALYLLRRWHLLIQAVFRVAKPGSALTGDCWQPNGRSERQVLTVAFANPMGRKASKELWKTPGFRECAVSSVVEHYLDTDVKMPGFLKLSDSVEPRLPLRLPFFTRFQANNLPVMSG